MTDEFSGNFQAITATDDGGYPPFLWQRRLFDELARGNVPSAMDIPTGLGKTAVMAVWLLARAAQASVPRRLVYVVDRRAVVDQATAYAERIRANLRNPELAKVVAGLQLRAKQLPISTLRGGFADNREWLADPVSPAIIVGTVDMIGSRLLFEGYGVSRKMRPYHAGLLGADSLLVLDEAHLSAAFAGLVKSIGAQEIYGCCQDPQPIRLLALSATGRGRSSKVFRLTEEECAEPEVERRLKATKEVSFIGWQEGDGAAEDAIYEQAWSLVKEVGGPARILIFLNSRKQALGVREKFLAEAQKQRREKQRSKTPEKQPEDRPEEERFPFHESELFLLTGARRGWERDRGAEELAQAGFFAEGKSSLQQNMFLIATSAGEVGIDLDADHMVCDLVAWERMVQRLGRVNRRGRGQAKVRVLDIRAPESKADSKREERLQQTGKLFQKLPKSENGWVQAGPGEIAELSKQESDAIASASTPDPIQPGLTRPLVDAWAMTSLREHTGRPEVTPWLRGWAEDVEPQTTVVWRRFLPVKESPDGVVVDPKIVQKFFEATPPHVSEKLEAEVSHVLEWLVGLAKGLYSKGLHSKGGEGSSKGQVEFKRPRPSGTDPVLFKCTDIACLLIRQSFEYVGELTIQDFLDWGSPGKKKKEPKEFLKNLPGSILVLNAKISGLSEEGALDKNALLCFDREEESALCTADWDRDWQDKGTDGASSAPMIHWRVLLRKITDSQESADSEEEQGIEGQGIEGQGIDADWRPKAVFDVKISQADEVEEWIEVRSWRGRGDDDLARAVAIRRITLEDHSAHVEQRACEFARALCLPSNEINAFQIAGRQHDQGKAAEIWQRAMNAPLQGGPYAKTRGGNGRLLQGYRHEFGSLLHTPKLPEWAALSTEDKDLILHLIVAHHGYARPLISSRGCEDGPPSVLLAEAGAVAQRYARLHRRYGPWGLAWREAILRAADQLASREEQEEASG